MVTYDQYLLDEIIGTDNLEFILDEFPFEGFV